MLKRNVRRKSACIVRARFNSYGRLDKARNEDLLTDPRLFLQIKKGDTILAYAGGNRIAYVGTIADGKYVYTRKNIVGREEGKGGFGYANQYKVNWWEKPFDFSRYDLPRFIWSQLGKRGRTVIPIMLHRRSFDQVKQIIMTSADELRRTFKLVS